MDKPLVVVVDYGVGNLLSVQRALEHCGAQVILSANPDQILSAYRVILPGVGAFSNAMQVLESLGLVDVIRKLSDRKIPLLGICLGMQLLFEESDEFGITSGLGLIPGRVIAVPSETTSGDFLKIPHIGWNSLLLSNDLTGWHASLLSYIQHLDSMYFLHSYMAVPSNAEHRIFDCLYGGHFLSAVVGFDHIIGCQFHPEKSGEVGLTFLRNFLT